MLKFGMFTELNTDLTKGMANVDNLGLAYANFEYDYAKEETKFKKKGKQFYSGLNSC